MVWQILTAIGAFVFSARSLLFLVGLLVGGMATVSFENVTTLMQTLVSWWELLMQAFMGPAAG